MHSKSKQDDLHKIDEYTLTSNGSTIRIIELEVTIDYNNTYPELLKAGAPETLAFSEVHEISYYSHQRCGWRKTFRFTLLNFPDGGGSLQGAIQFADRNRLRKSNPCQMFAVTAKAGLCEKLGFTKPISLVATNIRYHRHALRVVYVNVRDGDNGNFRQAFTALSKTFGIPRDWLLFCGQPSSQQ